MMVDQEKDVRQYIQETIVKDGLGVHDATEKEIDTLMGYKSNALVADFTLADMISRRAQIGVSPPFEDDLNLSGLHMVIQQWMSISMLWELLRERN